MPLGAFIVILWLISITEDLLNIHQHVTSKNLFILKIVFEAKIYYFFSILKKIKLCYENVIILFSNTL